MDYLNLTVTIGLFIISAIFIWLYYKKVNRATKHYYIKTKATLLYTKPRENDDYLDTFWFYTLDNKDFTNVLGDETTVEYFKQNDIGKEFDVFVTTLVDDDGNDLNFVCWYPNFEDTYLQYDKKSGNYILKKN